MSKHDQTHFLDKLRRTVEPSPQRAEPLVWFREVRILTELSKKEGVERRKIVLHRGLNILWAAPEDPDTEQGLYRDGLAGHASGKTLFCRLLRHLLGELPFGTKAQREPGMSASSPCPRLRPQAVRGLSMSVTMTAPRMSANWP